MNENIKFYSFDLEAETDALMLSNAESHQVYIAVECQNGLCDQRKLLHPSSLPVSPDEFQNLNFSEIAARLKCVQCMRKKPKISYFKEYDPLYTGEMKSENDLVPFHWLSKDGSFVGGRYNYVSTPASGWVRPVMYDDDPHNNNNDQHDRGNLPDPRWSDDEQLVQAEIGYDYDTDDVDNATNPKFRDGVYEDE